jgi:hypothetical protein
MRVPRTGALLRAARGAERRRDPDGEPQPVAGPSPSTPSDSGRRDALKSAAAIAVGAVGLVAVDAGRRLNELTGGRAPLGTRSSTIDLTPATVTPSDRASVSRMTLYGTEWELVGGTRRPGDLPVDGERGGARGLLATSNGGEAVGAFQSAWFFTDRAVSGLEMHTFQLPAGLLLGLGTSEHGEGTYAIVGGTGAYAGKTGSYRASQQVREVGGDGTATFEFELMGGLPDVR